jgi:4-methylaminobutanoate oxidase (formaldehyde-forming)
MGPKSRDLLKRLTREDLSLGAFPLYTFRDLHIGPTSVRAARLSYVGELGWELYVARDKAPALYDALFAHGSDFGLVDAGMYALTSLRIEKGYRAWGHELTPDDTPFEAGLQFAVKLSKPVAFLGRAALEARATQPLTRRLLHFVLDDTDVLPIGGEPIWQDSKIVGQVTSAAFGHTLGRAVAMGYVRVGERTPAEAMAEQGYAIEIAAELYTARASLVAPYDPTGARIRQ